MKIYSTPRMSEKIPRDYFNPNVRSYVDGDEIIYITNFRDTMIDYPSVEKLQESKRRILSLIGRTWKFKPRVVDLLDFVGKKDKLFKELEPPRGQKNINVFADGGCPYDQARLGKASHFSEWLFSQKQNPDVNYIGFSAGLCSLGSNFDGVEIWNDAEANYFKLGTNDRTGYGIIGDILLMQHWNSPLVADEKNMVMGDIINKTLDLRNKKGLKSIAISDTSMLEWDLITNQKKVVKWNGGDITVTDYGTRKGVKDEDLYIS